jgi:hypothetical protein
MNKKIGYILLFLILKTIFSFSQNQIMNNDTKEIILQGKDAIIAYAFTIIKEKMPTLEVNPKNYEITVWANKKEALVKFRRRIKYYPKNNPEGITYDFSVNIITQEIDIWSIDDFFIPTKQDLKNIEFVKKHAPLPSSDQFEISIRETKDQFQISCTNKVAFGKYFIDKQTGKELPSIQGSYIPAPKPLSKKIEKDPLKEIFDSTTHDQILDIISTKTSVNPNMDEFIEITDILSIKEFEKIKNFILKKGDRRFYRNYDSGNPHFHFNDFHTYLNSEIGQRNIDNDPEISDFNEITIHDWNEHDLQYYTIKIVRKGDVKNELIYVEEEMKENNVYLLNVYEKDLNLLLKNLKEHYLVKLRDQINTNR